MRGDVFKGLEGCGGGGEWVGKWGLRWKARWRVVWWSSGGGMVWEGRWCLTGVLTGFNIKRGWAFGLGPEKQKGGLVKVGFS